MPKILCSHLLDWRTLNNYARTRSATVSSSDED